MTIEADEPDPALTEPTVVPCLYVTGMHIEISDAVVRLVGWVALPRIDGQPEERRIVIRFAMPMDVASDLGIQTRKKLGRAGRY